MPVQFYMDVHVPIAIGDQLRRRGVDVLTAAEDGTVELSDESLLQRASELNRVMFTQDIRFLALAESWIREGRPFAGLVFGHQLRGTIGQFVKDLHFIAQASDPEEWHSMVERIPF